MQTKRNSLIVSGILVVAFLGLGAGCTRGTSAPEVGAAGHIGPASLRAKASELQGTIVSAHLEEQIPPGKNVLWCATFQLAWNELMDRAGGPVTMPKPPTMVDALNRQGFTSSGVDSGSYVAIAGLIGEGTLDRAGKEVARKFPGASPKLLRAAEGLPPDSLVMYAFLAKVLPFQYAFRRLGGMRFRAGSDAETSAPAAVENFGIYQYTPGCEAHSKQARQVRILWHKFEGDRDRQPQQFIVELLTTSNDDRLILASIPPKNTLAETVSEAMRLIEKPNTLLPEEPIDPHKLADPFNMPPDQLSRYACLMYLENIEVPILDFDIGREFSELYGQNVQARNPKVNGLPFAFAREQIRFRLDEKGAALESEGGGGLFAGPPRDFSFRRPFLIMLLRKGEPKPYFALWVGNSELLVKAAEHQEEPLFGG